MRSIKPKAWAKIRAVAAIAVRTAQEGFSLGFRDGWLMFWSPFISLWRAVTRMLQR